MVSKHIKLLVVCLIAWQCSAVAAGINRAPQVDAGPDDTLRTNYRNCSLSGTIYDDGFPGTDSLRGTWRQISGPAAIIYYPDGAIKDTAMEMNTPFSISDKGIYEFELKGTDGELTTFDTAVVAVLDSLPFVVTSPVEGQNVEIGKPCFISWIRDPYYEVKALLSLDSGRTFALVVARADMGYGENFATWNVSPLLPEKKGCLLKIQEYISGTATVSAFFNLVKPASIAQPTLDYNHRPKSALHVGCIDFIAKSQVAALDMRGRALRNNAKPSKGIFIFKE
jgi:hypothetical protein